ncbi:MAG: hypothetical protein KKA10_00600 [Euryarchaeota archaeon]|nr:hypothetical protein [Euryarchaeota archaeon]MCG2734882.1 hypothetical protein [Candidatus Methanoperedenaceae archaeon]
MLKRLLVKAEVDRAVFFGLLLKVWSIITAPMTALLIATQFTPELQGYYYTFGSLLALQIFVELGLGTVIIQFASHEWSKLGIDKTGHIVGDRNALSRLISLANITLRWYLIGGLLVSIGLGMGGYVFFSQSSNLNINWVLPWLTLSVLTGVTICLVPVWSLLEGCNQVTNVYTYRFWQGLFASLSIWIAILLGAELWTASISSIVVLICSGVFLRYKYWNFLKILLLFRPTGPRIEWRREILPMQWRIAISWISGYFVFSLFTPIIFHYHGPVIAGQFGMTWSVVGMVSSISSSWLFPKVPQFGMLIARKEYNKLDILFWRITKISVIITVLAAITAWFTIYILNKLNHPFAFRLLPILPTTIFLIAQVIMMSSLPLSLYMRAHKKEPILFVSVLGGVATGLSTFILGKYYYVTEVAMGYLVINVIIVPIIVLIWHRCRAEWHAGSAVS